MKPLLKPKPIVADEASKETLGIIKKQKGIAEEILTFASIMDHRAEILGGAPRNWELNRPANDLDVYLRVPNDASESHMINILEAFGVEGLFNVGRKVGKVGKAYNNLNQGIEYVLEGTYMNQRVQFIFLKSDSPTGLTYAQRFFDSSINMISCKLAHKGVSIHRTVRFIDTINTGVIFVQENGAAYEDRPHLERIHNYFPKCPMVHEKYRGEVLRDINKVNQYAECWEDLT